MDSYYDKTKQDMNELLKWKNSAVGKKYDFPKVDDMHKFIIFKSWKAIIHLVKKLINVHVIFRIPYWNQLMIHHLNQI